MTFDEVEKSLPNGFHDAFLRGLAVDYIERTAKMELEIWVGDLNFTDHDLREAYRRGLLQFSDLLFFTVDIPNARFLLSPEEDWRDEPIGLEVDAAPEGHDAFPQAGWPDDPLPEGAFIASFVFVGRVKSYLHIAARNANLEWLTEPRTIYGPP